LFYKALENRIFVQIIRIYGIFRQIPADCWGCHQKYTFKDKPAELYEPMNYIISHGGKRLRPIMVLMACDLFGGDLKEAIKPALAIEFFHNFTLIHDDIMDEAP
jgi:geranylgeranyl diphosphate synthase type II